MPDIKKLIAANLGKQKDLGVRSMTLTRIAPGTRTPGSEIDGTNPTSTSYACKAFVSTKRSGYQSQPASTQARTRYVTVSILGGTLPSGIEPRAGDRIVDGATTYTIDPNGVTSDPVGAVFDCVCRAPGA